MDTHLGCTLGAQPLVARRIELPGPLQHQIQGHDLDFEAHATGHFPTGLEPERPWRLDCQTPVIHRPEFDPWLPVDNPRRGVGDRELHASSLRSD